MDELEGQRIAAERIPILCRRGRACRMGAFVCDAFICDRVLLRPMPPPKVRLLPPDKSSNAREFSFPSEEVLEPWNVEVKR